MRGLGVDLCEVGRIERELKRGDAFLRRFFTDGERAYIASRGQMGSFVDSMPRIGSMAYASSFFGGFLRLR